MARTPSRFAVAVLCLIFAAPAARGATPAEIDQMIRQAKDHLYKLQSNGNWEAADADKKYGKDFPGGLTAVSLYALLASGESQTDPRIVSAVRYLKTVNATRTYTVGFRCLVWSLWKNQSEIRAVAQRDGRMLLSAGLGGKSGLYSYDAAHGGGAEFDNSNSQYGVLGLSSLEQAGLIEVPPRYWTAVDASWRKEQTEDGGWRYDLKPTHKDPTLSMTAAGIATEFITQDQLGQGVAVECRGNVKNESIDRGLDWMADHFQDVYNTYTWYGISRIGIASGYKYIGTNDWYAVGAEKLVREGLKGPDWTKWRIMPTGDVPGTAFGLLFLARGRAPVMMNKLKYDLVSAEGKAAEANWNQRPRDAANLSRWVGRQLETELHWQVVNLDVSPEDLHDAPLMYISGDQALNFDDVQVEKLKAFIEEGGILLANADCGSKTFADSYRKLGAKMFPTYEFRELPAEHPIIADEQFKLAKDGKIEMAIQGMSNGARELMLLVPDGDPSRYLQSQIYRGHEAAFQLMDDIFLYATGKSGLHNKGDTYVVTPDLKVKPTATIKVARLQYTGNWDPEPGGWRRLAAVMHNQRKLDLEVERVPLGEQKLSGYRVAHLTGTTAIKLTAEQRQAIQEFVHGGGTLIVDAAGGSKAFADSAKAELENTFGEDGKQLDAPLDLSIPVFQSGGTTFKPAFRGLGTLGQNVDLNGITLNNRLAVVFSPVDLSVALVGQPVDGVAGFTPESATTLVSDVIAAAGEGSK